MSLKWGNGDFLVVCFYVDDIIYMIFCELIVGKFKSVMISKFEMFDFGMLFKI